VGRERHFPGLPCWAHGYGVSTVGLDEQVIREDIRNQEQEEKRQEELRLQGLESLS
jgi:putative transposase